MHSSTIYASGVLLAAGSGTRYGGAKQDELFRGKPLWRWPYETLCSVLGAERVVVVGKDVPGGETRVGSVLAGLAALPADTQRVVVAEAARPLLTRAQVEELLADRHPSAAFARPLVNTVAYRDGRFIDRNELFEVLTPQVFDYVLLLETLQTGKYADSTDDTRAVFEERGVRPYYIETDSNLYKVTYPGDLAVIEAILTSMEEGNANA